MINLAVSLWARPIKQMPKNFLHISRRISVSCKHPVPHGHRHMVLHRKLTLLVGFVYVLWGKYIYCVLWHLVYVLRGYPDPKWNTFLYLGAWFDNWNVEITGHCSETIDETKHNNENSNCIFLIFSLLCNNKLETVKKTFSDKTLWRDQQLLKYRHIFRHRAILMTLWAYLSVRMGISTINFNFTFQDKKSMPVGLKWQRGAETASTVQLSPKAATAKRRILLQLHQQDQA